MIRSIAKKEAEVKKLEEAVRELRVGDMGSKMELIQVLIPVGLSAVNDILQQEVKEIVGGWYERNGKGYSRWGKQRGSVYLQDTKVPVLVPRVRDDERKEEVGLRTYQYLQEAHKGDEKLMKLLINGLSGRKYEECAKVVPGVFGISGATVSRRYISASAKKMKEICERRLECYDIIGIMLDGKTFSEDEMVIALGVTLKGQKVILGFIQTGSENGKACGEFLEGLIERGLRYEEGILFIIDGSKGIRRAIEEKFREYGIVQRCQFHKRENVISYLPKGKQAEMKMRLQNAYEAETYEGAKKKINTIKKELMLINESAVKSLEEGLEETLTLHALGIFKELGKSFKTTNCIESIMAQVERITGRVCYWKSSNQKQRWLASALMEIEPGLRKIKGWQHLGKLRIALKIMIEKKKDIRKAS